MGWGVVTRGETTTHSHEGALQDAVGTLFQIHPPPVEGAIATSIPPVGRCVLAGPSLGLTQGSQPICTSSGSLVPVAPARSPAPQATHGRPPSLPVRSPCPHGVPGPSARPVRQSRPTTPSSDLSVLLSFSHRASSNDPGGYGDAPQGTPTAHDLLSTRKRSGRISSCTVAVTLRSGINHSIVATATPTRTILVPHPLGGGLIQGTSQEAKVPLANDTT